MAERAGIDVDEVVTAVRKRRSREYPVSEAVLTRATGLQGGPDVEWNGTEFFVAWADTRETGDEETRDIYGTRVSGSGRVLDPGGIAISTGDDDERNPGVSWNGRSFLVVWKTFGDAELSVEGARVSTSGRVLDPSPILIERDGVLGGVASADGTSLVAYSRDGGVWAKRVTAAGEVIDRPGIAIAPISDGGSAAWNGSVFLVIGLGRGSHSTGLVAARVTVAGRVLDPSGISIAGVPNHGASVASDGISFLATWLDAKNDLYASRVGPDGRVLDPNGFAVASGAGSASASWNGRVFLVVWGPGLASRVTRTGRVLDPGGSSFDTDDEGRPYAPVVAAGGGDRFLVVWEGLHTEEIHDPDIHGALLTPDGRLPDPKDLLVSTAAPLQADPALAWNGRDFLVVWTEQRQHREWDLYAARVSATGAIRDGTGIPIASEPGGQWYAAVAWNGRHFLVTWADSRPDGEGVYGARIDARGRVLDPGGFAIATTDEGFTSTLGVASDGRDFLVVWDGERSDGYLISAARVTTHGRIHRIGPISRQTPGTNAGEPAVAWNGSTYLVVWTNFRQPDTSDIAGARLSRTGRVLDPAGIDIASTPRPQTQPAVASSGTTFFVAWSHDPWGSARVRGTRVDGNGRVLDPAPINLEQGSVPSYTPAITSYRKGFLVVWAAAGPQTRGVQVTRAGLLQNTTRFRIPTPGYAPAIASGPSKTWAMTYTHFAPPPLGATRVFLRTLRTR